MSARGRPGKTTVWVKDSTKELLEKAREYPGQPFDELIQKAVLSLHSHSGKNHKNGV